MTEAGVPNHVAIIMDGNGRWAKARGRSVSYGHRAGVAAIKRTMYACDDLGVKILSVYAFSTENWRRSRREVSALMRLFEETLEREFDELNQRGVRIVVSGRREGLSERMRKQIADAEELTRDNPNGVLNVCLNYGGRAELVDAVKRLVCDGVKPEDVSEAAIASRLYAPELPDPDLVIRTASETRLSNFLLWETAYSEFYVTPTLWPDFDKDALATAIAEFQRRTRRYGGRPAS
jgi:undecaprenyl diphosphate synthase